ncbi:MAG: DinB family protein [Chloroflexota bacterium]
MNLDELFSHWTLVRRGLFETIDKFRDEDLSFVPFEGCWSVGEIMLHIADAEEGWFRYGVTRELDDWPGGFTLQDYPNLTAIKNLLTEVHDRTEAYLGTLELADLSKKLQMPWGVTVSLGWEIWHVLEHEIHHRGELSLILGILGREGLDV